MYNKLILTDCDGVLLDWEYAFNIWMTEKGYTLLEPLSYNISKRYNIPKDKANSLVKFFNESALYFCILYRLLMLYESGSTRVYPFSVIQILKAYSQSSNTPSQSVNINLLYIFFLIFYNFTHSTIVPGVTKMTCTL